MKKLDYRYELHESFVAIMPVPYGSSVYADLDQILAQLEAKVPLLRGKHILCEGQDGYWDLIVSTEKRGFAQTTIYPLSALSLAEAQVKVCELIASGKHLEKIP